MDVHCCDSACAHASSVCHWMPYYSGDIWTPVRCGSSYGPARWDHFSTTCHTLGTAFVHFLPHVNTSVLLVFLGLEMFWGIYDT